MTTSERAISFRVWKKSVSKSGVNGFGEEATYVPYKQLKTYWCDNRYLREIIKTISPPISVSFETIAEQYLMVFSTLVDIGKPEAIRQFLAFGMGDNRLPLHSDELPAEWNHELDSFIHKQWPFCPWRFTRIGSDQRHLPPQQILPIRYEEPLVTNPPESTQAQVRIVKIDEDYCQIDAQEVIFKIYKGSSTEQLYRREASVYTRLRDFSKTGITKCYGSLGFPVTNTWIIILEYARGGSLLDFFKKEPPVNWEDHKLLWERLLEIIDGLYLLHNPNKPDLESFVGIHQDIQPANILVFPRSGDSLYDVDFKLADFGLTELVRGVGGEDTTVCITTEGNRMYSAPEAYSNFRMASEVRPRLNSVADLWSLGAVFSDFLVWSIGGNRYRDIYLERRRAAIAALSHIEESGFVACFHDTNERLPEVDSFHEEILTHKRAVDVLSPCMSDFILDYMMVAPELRMSAQQAKGHTRKIMIRMAQESPIPKRTPTPDYTHPPNSHNQPRPDTFDRSSSQFGFPNRVSFIGGDRKVTIEEVYSKIKNKTPSLFKRVRSSEAGMRLPGMQPARNMISNPNGRDQIFVIDDYESMRVHKLDVAMAARVISYTVKVSDKNGMDLYFASDSCKPRKFRNSKDIEDSIRNKWTVPGHCNMWKCLDDVLKGVKAEGMQPTSIYIFTDGNWDPEYRDKVDGVIHKAIKLLIDNQKEPVDLMFQFIQFGLDIEGYKRLKYLDDGCKRKHNNVEYDIVDTKPWDGDVPKIIIGSLSRYNDDD